MKVREPISIIIGITALYWVVSDLIEEPPKKQCYYQYVEGNGTKGVWSDCGLTVEEAFKQI